MVMRRVTNTETFVKPCTEHLSCETWKDEKMASPLKNPSPLQGGMDGSWQKPRVEKKTGPGMLTLYKQLGS